ncbi:response regulator [Thiocystis minor]|uniref:response regulator n=1 Tax=Thiocystis minor TaxID=61597 RepID=UPI001913347D|nr:response regulator [Thiocystis minor]
MPDRIPAHLDKDAHHPLRQGPGRNRRPHEGNPHLILAQRRDRGARVTAERVEGALDFLDRIIFNTQRASQIIEKIRGLIPPAQARHEPVDLARLIQEVGELVATETRPRKAIFDFHLPERPLWAMGDPIQLTRMVLNLLRNAIDAPSHGQRCDIEVCLRELEGGALRQVQDRGPRLGSEVLRQAGRPFLAAKTLELGRGLDHSISCAIAERHGGNLTLTNAQGGGVLAELRLPLKTVAPPDLHLAVQDRPAHRPMRVSDRRLANRCARGHVVVIDHDVEILAALRAIFELEGYACETYDSAVAYLQVLNDNRPCFPGPCCLLCDVRLPELDGLELQRRLAELKAIPMLLMGSASGAPEAVSALRAGALDVLIKPVDAETLLDAVARALAVSAERQRQGARRCELAARLSTLTNREREVARRVALGQRNLAIAEGLGIALRTVKRHRQQVMEKLEADTLVDLVRVIDEAGGTRSPIR